jgi:hypothetical protein
MKYNVLADTGVLVYELCLRSLWRQTQDEVNELVKLSHMPELILSIQPTYTFLACQSSYWAKA